MNICFFRPSSLLRAAFFILFCFPIAAFGSETLVYYANETSLEPAAEQNLGQLLGWLNQLSDIPKAKKIAANLELDRKIFPKRVTDDLQALSHSRLSVFAFTNDLARRGKYLKKSADGKFQELDFPSGFLNSRDPIFQINRLSNPDNFDRVVRWLSTNALQTQSEVGFVFFSHGSTDLAITPRLTLWTSDFTRERVTAVLSGSERLQHKGISRERFFETIRSLGDTSRVPIKFVLLHSCGASPKTPGYDVGKRVESFFTGSRVLIRFDLMDYRVESLESIVSSLRRDPEIMEFRRATAFSLVSRKLVYFVPLLLLVMVMLLFFVYGRRDSRQRKHSFHPDFGSADFEKPGI